MFNFLPFFIQFQRFRSCCIKFHTPANTQANIQKLFFLYYSIVCFANFSLFMVYTIANKTKDQLMSLNAA